MRASIKYTSELSIQLNDGDSFTKGANDASGKSALKLGTSSKTCELSFTVYNDVNEVVIYIAQYKTNSGTVTINGETYELTTSSNLGDYTAIVIDTTTIKTISLTTNKRAMSDKIIFK